MLNKDQTLAVLRVVRDRHSLNDTERVAIQRAIEAFDGGTVDKGPALFTALQNLVKINEDHNAAVEKIIGKPPGWNDSYLDAAREALSNTMPVQVKIPKQAAVPTPKPFPEHIDSRFWQDGEHGSANIVSFDGEDVRPVTYVREAGSRADVIRKHNDTVRSILNGTNKG